MHHFLKKGTLSHFLKIFFTFGGFCSIDEILRLIFITSVVQMAYTNGQCEWADIFYYGTTGTDVNALKIHVKHKTNRLLVD